MSSALSCVQRAHSCGCSRCRCSCAGPAAGVSSCGLQATPGCALASQPHLLGACTRGGIARNLTAPALLRACSARARDAWRGVHVHRLPGAPALRHQLAGADVQVLTCVAQTTAWPQTWGLACNRTHMRAPRLGIHRLLHLSCRACRCRFTTWAGGHRLRWGMRGLRSHPNAAMRGMCWRYISPCAGTS